MIIFNFIYLSTSIYGQIRLRKHSIVQSKGATLVEANKDLSESNEVRIEIQGEFRIIKSNGVPSHKVGKFPNPGNPNAILKQKHIYRVPLKPKYNNNIVPLEMAFDFGVAVNGVPFDPGAAEWFQGIRNSKWQYEALSGAITLGVDENHAHVQPTGAYHYHGLPTNLLKKLGVESGKESPLVGFAADGHPIYAIYGKEGKELKSSYVLKNGTRPIGGTYDGTFVADYTFQKSKGDLDECNGVVVNGKYSYFLTKDFPVIPRCFRGTPDESFRRDRHNISKNEKDLPMRVPIKALKACKGKSKTDRCSFTGRRGEHLNGACSDTPGGKVICRPEHRH